MAIVETRFGSGAPLSGIWKLPVAAEVLTSGNLLPPITAIPPEVARSGLGADVAGYSTETGGPEGKYFISSINSLNDLPQSWTNMPPPGCVWNDPAFSKAGQFAVQANNLTEDTTFIFKFVMKPRVYGAMIVATPYVNNVKKLSISRKPGNFTDPIFQQFSNNQPNVVITFTSIWDGVKPARNINVYLVEEREYYLNVKVAKGIPWTVMDLFAADLSTFPTSYIHCDHEQVNVNENGYTPVVYPVVAPTPALPPADLSIYEYVHRETIVEGYVWLHRTTDFYNTHLLILELNSSVSEFYHFSQSDVGEMAATQVSVSRSPGDFSGNAIYVSGPTVYTNIWLETKAGISGAGHPIQIPVGKVYINYRRSNYTDKVNRKQDDLAFQVHMTKVGTQVTGLVGGAVTDGTAFNLSAQTNVIALPSDNAAM